MKPTTTTIEYEVWCQTIVGGEVDRRMASCKIIDKAREERASLLDTFQARDANARVLVVEACTTRTVLD